MKKSLKVFVSLGMVAVVVLASSALCSCKSSKNNNGGIMYQRAPQRNKQVIKSNYNVVSENQVTVSTTDFELPRI